MSEWYDNQKQSISNTSFIMSIFAANIFSILSRRIEFRDSKYDVASLDYQRKTKSALVLALAIVLGGMLGIVVLLIRNALIKQD